MANEDVVNANSGTPDTVPSMQKLTTNETASTSKENRDSSSGTKSLRWRTRRPTSNGGNVLA